ncbi:tyrosine-type recombinase/integrase [Candidatus Puniceispirillum marinum]|uniref:Putative integrase protein n=1 Tax=Puniceispirillum marinum (strain IMCC1322) TaxID=488538 RepID=D5BQS6_PUNMI|nr:tyrosine-type recombinase/integrase [Candidatus Puniceispirillum marinum]ADE38640.1 putative integrase protein [Candidatus Puniceispirillum marinum IMCC1322]
MTFEQHDLFDFTPSTPEPVTPTVQEPSVTVAQPILRRTPEQWDEGGLWDFAQRYGHEMWPAETHRYRSMNQLKRFLDFSDNRNLSISSILPMDVDDFVIYLSEEGNSVATCNRYVATVSKVMRTAQKKRIIKMAPSFTFGKETGGRPRTYSKDEIDAIREFFVDNGDQYMADMVTVACMTGMRKTEIVKMAMGNLIIDEDVNWVIIPCTHAKNGHERTVPLKHCKDAVRRLCISIPEKYTHRTFYRRWGLAKEHFAPNDPHFVFHVTRHTAASVLANDVKLPTILISKQLGHISPTTTMKYVHSKVEALAEAQADMAKYV